MCYKSLQALVPIAQYSKQGATLNIAKRDICVGHLVSPGLPTVTTSPQVTSHSYLGRCFQGWQYGFLICLFLQEASVHIVDSCFRLTGYEGGCMVRLKQGKGPQPDCGCEGRSVQGSLGQVEGVARFHFCTHMPSFRLGKPSCTP